MEAASPTRLEAFDPSDAIALAQALIRCPSVTPVDAGALDLVQGLLEGLGFRCHRLVFGGGETGRPAIDNLYARFGETGPHFAYGGHTDVVPVGDEAAWSFDPFAGLAADGSLKGRGACDMKSSVAAFIAAVARHLAKGPFEGSISLILTGDEEGPATDGTVRLVEWLRDRGEKVDHCVVGEPTSAAAFGDTIKVGRRGSLNGWLTIEGQQGHVAYPHKADNPVPAMLSALSALNGLELDQGTEHFQPSNLEIVSVDVGNATTNLIPAKATALFNCRFNALHSGASLAKLFEETARGGLDRPDRPLNLTWQFSAEPFFTEPGAFTDQVVAAVEAVSGVRPALTTGGGTSDARFLKDLCPVVEFGLVGRSMHQVDESVPLAEVTALSKVYETLLERYFAEPPLDQ